MRARYNYYMNYDSLKLKNQICHPLYSVANTIVRNYDPHLKKLNLTYPQYLVMMSLWEEDKVAIKKISQDTFFDSGSLTPILKRLEDKGFIVIESSKNDLRQKVIILTKKGNELKDKALNLIPELVACFSSLTLNEAKTLKELLNKLFLGMAEDK